MRKMKFEKNIYEKNRTKTAIKRSLDYYNLD